MKIQFTARTRVDGQERAVGETADVPWRLAAGLIEARLAMPADPVEWQQHVERRKPWILRWRN
jgi:hypothetical protein